MQSSSDLRFQAAVERPLSLAFRGRDGARERRDYTVTVVAERAGLDEAGVVMDFRALDAALDAALEPMRGRGPGEFCVDAPLDAAMDVPLDAAMDAADVAVGAPLDAAMDAADVAVGAPLDAAMDAADVAMGVAVCVARKIALAVAPSMAPPATLAAVSLRDGSGRRVTLRR